MRKRCYSGDLRMLVQRGYKFELKVNNKERTKLLKGTGIARFAWNWGLADRIQRYKDNKGNERYTDAMKQHKLLNSLKKTNYSWIYEVSKCIPQEALRDLEQAFQNFYRDRKNVKTKKKKRKVGFPRFKKKYKSKDSFRLTGTIKVFPKKKRIQLPRLGKLRVYEIPQMDPTARVLSATVSRTADKWFVALTAEEEEPKREKSYDNVVGLDAGLARFTTLSLGLPIPKPKFLLKRLKKFRCLSKAHSRKQPGSNNRKKSAKRLAKFHQRVTYSRKDFQHKLSLHLVKNHDVLVVEDLYVKGLIQNKKQSRHWADLAHGEFRRFLKYKSEKYGKLLVEADRWFPSSKSCSNCLMRHPNLRLQDRIFHCPFCELEIDRDYNAAINLEHYFYIYIQPQLNLVNHVTDSSAETQNAGRETLRPIDKQARLDEAGKLAPKSLGHKCL